MQRQYKIEKGVENELEFVLQPTEPRTLRVLDRRDRSPVSGAKMVCRSSTNPDALVVAPDGSDTNGCVLMGIPLGPATWECRIRAVGFAQRQILVTAGALPDPALLDPTSEFAGCVAMGDGRPVEGVRLTLSGSQGWRGFVETDATGCFAEDVQASKIVYVRAERPGYITRDSSSSEGLSSPVMIALDRSETGVYGQVLDGEVPLRKPFLMTMESADGAGLERSRVFSNEEADGRFEIRELPAGTYDIHIVTDLEGVDPREGMLAASLKAVELRRGFITGPLVPHLKEWHHVDRDPD